MKSKKMIILGLLAVFSLSAQAQLLTGKTSRTFKEQKGPRKFLWTARIGYSFDNMTGADNVSGTTGFDGGFGFTHYLGESRESGLFWGLEAHGMSNSAYYDLIDQAVFAIAVVGAPRIGYKIPIPNTNFAVAPYVGAYVGFLFDGHESEYMSDNFGTVSYMSTGLYPSMQTTYMHRYGANRLELGDNVTAGLNIGVQFFLTKGFFLDMHVKKSLMEDGETEEVSNCYIPYDMPESMRADYEQYNYSRGEKVSGFKFVLGVGFEF